MDNVIENFRDFLGCRCHANAFYSRLRFNRDEGSKATTPAHTFPWAVHNYPPERPVWPQSQSLDLRVDIDKEELSGSNTIQIKFLRDGIQSFKLDAADLHIHDVQLNKLPVKFATGAQQTEIFIETPFKRGDTAELKVTYSTQKPKAGMYFIKPDDKYPQRPVQVWTQGQDDDARFWIPCFDEPRIKCPIDLKVEVPAGFIATSNGALTSSARGGKTWTFHWKTSVHIPAYLVTLTVGKFSEIKEDWRGKPVIYLCEKGREDETKLSFGKTPQMMELFSQKTGVDYPYEKYAQITAAEFIFGGMENTSATTQTDHVLHPYEIEEDYSSDDLVSHELAHQWFGDLVTCKSWSHGWLNEGWATFMEQVFKEQDLGREETEYYRYEELNIYLHEESSLYKRPIVTNFYADPGEIWDRHLYQKGGLVLDMLRAKLGEEDFWAGTKQYLNNHRGGTVETVDFQRCMEQASGLSLQEFFDQWVYKAGHPEMRAEFDWDEKNKIGKFKLAQKQAASALVPLFKINSAVEFVFADGGTHVLPLEFSQAEQTFCVPLREKPAYCRFDAGNHIIKTLEWAMPLDMIREQLAKDTDVVGKIWAMKQLAKEASKEGIELIAERLKSDSFWAVRAEAALALGEAKGEAALKALLGAISEESRSKTRNRICQALGNFRDERAASSLIHAVENDKSLFVRGAAAGALGKTKSPKAFDVLKKALSTKTWNDHLAASAYSGLKHLRDERALELFKQGSRYGAAKFARLTAVAALGEYGLTDHSVTELLNDCLEDPFFRVRFAAADALARRKDPSAAPVLEDAAYRIIDGHFKAAAFRAANRLRESQEKPQELISIQEDLQKLRDENKKLRDRIDLIEQS